MIPDDNPFHFQRFRGRRRLSAILSHGLLYQARIARVCCAEGDVVWNLTGRRLVRIDKGGLTRRGQATAGVEERNIGNTYQLYTS